jgi:hypothetical protein
MRNNENKMLLVFLCNAILALLMLKYAFAPSKAFIHRDMLKKYSIPITYINSTVNKCHLGELKSFTNRNCSKF